MIRCRGYKTHNRVIDIPKEKDFSYKLKPIFSPPYSKTTKYKVIKSSKNDMSFKSASNFCNSGTFPTIEQFKSLNFKKNKCYWSATTKAFKQYYYQNGTPKYINTKYDEKKCFVKCITPKSGGT